MMLTADQCSTELRRRKFEKPFRPFIIKAANGRSFPVNHGQAYAMNSYAVLVVGENGGQVRFQNIMAIEDVGGDAQD